MIINDMGDITLYDFAIFKKCPIHEKQGMRFKIFFENYEAFHMVIVELKLHFKISLS